jgi:UbiA prenyltransferase family protein
MTTPPNRVAVGRLIRRSNWWDSKIPPLLALAYLQILVLSVPVERALVALAALLVSAISLAAAAHVLTDSFDLEQDRRAGKSNALGVLKPWQRIALYSLLAVCGLAPWAFIHLDLLASLWLALIYLIPILYAAPPIRLKERGLWGAVADASMAHAAPTFFVLALFAGLAPIGAPNTIGLMIAAGLWSFCYGLRGILLHQILDRPSDALIGVKTFVVQVGIARAQAYILKFIFPVEMIGLGSLLLFVLPLAPLFFLGGLLFVGYDIVKQAYLWRQRFDPAPTEPGIYIPPHDVYEIWLPILSVMLLAARDVVYAPLLVAQVIFFHENLAARTRDVLRLFMELAANLPLWVGRLIGRARRATIRIIRR